MPFTDEEIMRMTPEERQQAIQDISIELKRRKRGTMGILSRRRFDFGGALRGAARGWAGQPPVEPEIENDLTTFIQKEQIKRDIREKEEPTEFEQERLDIQTQREERIAKEQERRQKRYEIDNLFNIGGEIGEEELKTTEKTILQDLKSQLEAGRGIPTIDKEGNRKWLVKSNAEWNAIIAQKKFAPSEIEHLQNIRTEHRAWTNVLDRLKTIGIIPSSAGKIEFDVINSPIGPLSIPARFDLFAQFRLDPKYTAIKKDIELAFQAFRKRVTGSQASDRELKMLRPLIADLKSRPEIFFEIVNNAIENAEIAFNDKIDIYKRAGRDTSEFDDFFPTIAPGIKKERIEEEEIEEKGIEEKEIDDYNTYLEIIGR